MKKPTIYTLEAYGLFLKGKMNTGFCEGSDVPLPPLDCFLGFLGPTEWWPMTHETSSAQFRGRVAAQLRRIYAAVVEKHQLALWRRRQAENRKKAFMASRTPEQLEGLEAYQNKIIALTSTGNKIENQKYRLRKRYNWVFE